MSMPYSAAVMHYFRQRERAGSMELNTDSVGVGQSGSISNGEVVVMQVAVDPEDNVSCVRFQVQGSVVTMAACAFAAEWLEGRSRKQAQALTAALISETLSLPRTKKHCALLVEDAVHFAMDPKKEEE